MQKLKSLFWGLAVLAVIAGFVKVAHDQWVKAAHTEGAVVTDPQTGRQYTVKLNGTRAVPVTATPSPAPAAKSLPPSTRSMEELVTAVDDYVRTHNADRGMSTKEQAK